MPIIDYAFLHLGLAAWLTTAVPTFQSNPTDSLDQWLDQEALVSIRQIFKNISPNDGIAGSVIASPSRLDPNYYFHWVRDAAITMDVVVRLYLNTPEGKQRQDYLKVLSDFAHFSRQNQTSGAIGGIGEPKYFVDGKNYNDPWGRPQNDGPALRALALIRLGDSLHQSGEEPNLLRFLYDGRLPSDSVVKEDLEYTSHHWEDRSFDLWEEVGGDHFYTRLVQRNALLAGARFSRDLGDDAAADWYEKQGLTLNYDLKNFWDQNKQIIVPTLNQTAGWVTKPSQIDSSILLAILNGQSPPGAPFGILDDRVLSTAQAIENKFSSIYGINQKGNNVGPAIGRYPEDVYYNGNPWFLTTLAFAEFYHRLANAIDGLMSFQVTETNLSWAKKNLEPALRAPVTDGTILWAKDPAWKTFVQNLREKGDSFFERVKLHVDSTGSIWEQYSKDTGYQMSAKDLTWSYAAFMTAYWAKQKISN